MLPPYDSIAFRLSQVLQTLAKQGKPAPPTDRDPLDDLALLEELSLESESDGGSDSSVSDGTPAQCVAQNKARRLKKKRKSKRSRNKNKERKKRVRSRAGQLNIITTSTLAIFSFVDCIHCSVNSQVSVKQTTPSPSACPPAPLLAPGGRRVSPSSWGAAPRSTPATGMH